MIHKIVTFSFFFFSFCAIYESSSNSKPKDFKIERLTPCPNDELPVKLKDIVISQPMRNKYMLNGNISTTVDINASLKVDLAVTRCNIDMSYCEEYDRFVIPKLCHRLQSISNFWKPFFQNIHPVLECPLRKGTYTVENATIDLNLISKLPLEGYRWLLFTKVMTHNVNDDQSEQEILCVECEVSITVVKRKL